MVCAVWAGCTYCAGFGGLVGFVGRLLLFDELILCSSFLRWCFVPVASPASPFGDPCFCHFCGTTIPSSVFRSDSSCATATVVVLSCVHRLVPCECLTTVRVVRQFDSFDSVSAVEVVVVVVFAVSLLVSAFVGRPYA